MVELKLIFEWFLLRASFAALSALTAGFVLYWLADTLGNVVVKRCGVPFAVLFALSSAWAAYTAFPSSDEKLAQKYSLYHVPSEAKPDAVSPTLLTPEDFARGYVLTRSVSNEVHYFSAPATARICEKWRLRGSNRDRYCIRSSQDLPWSFPSAASSFDKVVVRSSGVVELGDCLARLEPYNGNLGIVPEANWGNIILNAETQSCFWSFLTSSNSLQLTWQNVLHNRLADKPVSFQCEFLENGNFIYRYNLSSIDEALTTRYYHRLDPDDSPGSDRDCDGLSIDDEIFVHRTDPYCRDTDFDGLSDHEELFRYGTDPRNPNSLSEIYSDGFALKLGDCDPFSYPLGSTNTVLEHIFYSGTTNGAFAYPQSSDSRAVLKVSISGSGSGDLIVGETVVPLLPKPAMQRSATSPTELLVSLPKGVTLPLRKRGGAAIDVALDSSDFSFGVLPAGGKAGWIHFPNTKADTPCIHDYNARKKSVTLPVGKDAEGVVCTWAGGAGVEVENFPPRSAEITGRFNPKEESGLSYSLSHPQYLFGETTYSQTVRFCPKPPEETENEEDSPWYSNDDSFDGSSSCCISCELGLCGGSCGCGCNCNCESNGEDNPEPDEPPGDEICPVHNLAYAECASLHEEEYTNALANAQQLGGVLYIREPLAYEEIHLDVPSEYRNCCPCPDHWTNYVSVAYKSSRLSLVDADGNEFERTDKNCNVMLAGASPSREVGDAKLAFARNGEVYLEFAKTVLGVGISAPNLEKCNSLNESFGIPLTVCTNAERGAELNLITNVKLPTGNIHLELADVSGKFALWYYDSEIGDYRKLLDSQTMRQKTLPIAAWKEMMKRSGSAPNLPVYITSAESGSAKLIFRYWAVIDGKFVQDSAEQRITSVLPPLLPDMNLDGRIDTLDVIEYLRGRLFRFWTNEDTVKGDYVGHNPDTARNSTDNVVNGRYDLVNLFAAKLNLKPFIDAWGSSVTFELSSCGEDTMRYCAVNVDPNEAGKIYKDDTLTRNGGIPLHSAPLNAIQYDGISINPSEVLGEGNTPGVLAFEAAAAGETVTLWVKVDDEVVYSFEMPISISSVKDMYSWIGVRHLSGGEDIFATTYRKMWENEAVKSLIFIHGYNVTGAGAKVWGDQMFKRLWLSGLKAEFYNVNWRGDIGSNLNYHQNASNAFVVASQLAPIIKTIPGEKVLMAHSLGNIVASSMMHDHDLLVSRYIMCNSAVPAEAYDTSVSLRVPQLVHPDWEEYPEISWSANWHSLFADDEKDDRRYLGWKGRFSKVLPVAVNFYSAGDEVLELLSDNNVGILSGITDSFAHHAWHKQELFKGRGIGVGAGATDWSGWNIEENWIGVNKISVEQALSMNNADFKTNTVFYCYPPSMNATNISLLVRGAHLAQGIPALTPAAGAIEITTLGAARNHNLDNIDEDSGGVSRPNGWPSKTSYPNRWLHSDIKDVSYFFNFKFYEKVIEKGGLQ